MNVADTNGFREQKITQLYAPNVKALIGTDLNLIGVQLPEKHGGQEENLPNT